MRGGVAGGGREERVGRRRGGRRGEPSRGGERDEGKRGDEASTTLADVLKRRGGGWVSNGCPLEVEVL